MSPDELRARVASGEVHTVVMAFPDVYGRLMGKRLDAGYFLDRALSHGTHACDYLFTVDMEMQPVPGYSVASWAQGYGDVHVVPDLASIRPAGWSPGTAWVMCDVFDQRHDQPLEVAPRTVLRAQCDRLAAAGFDARAASEIEFFVFAESYARARALDYRNLSPAGWYVEDYHLLQGARVEPFVGRCRQALRDSEIPVESSKGEAGRGQHELNVAHAAVHEMADRHALMKHAMKEIADAMGLGVTFMAKPHDDDAGSSCHLHLSLWRGEEPAFPGGAGAPSDLFRWFLGGWIRHAGELMLCWAPTVNSYKRFRPESWAPTSAAWAWDNRTVGFRVVGGGPDLRIECRLPGADANPYLAYAAAIAAGLRGIEHRIEPPPELIGDGYRSTGAPTLPVTLDEALVAFRASEVARDAFGAAVVDHYAHFAEVERDAFRSAVTDWERVRYFERI